MRKMASIILAATVALGAVAAAPAAEARPGVRHGTVGKAYAARGRGYRRGRGNVAAGAAVVGIAGALIGGAIASQNRRDYYDDGYYAPRPAYGYAPAYGYSPYGY